MAHLNHLITSFFRTHSAKQFVESITESANSIYYVTGGKHIPWDDDGNPDEPTGSVSESIDVYNDMSYGKNITLNDVQHMSLKYIWSSGTVYSIYDDVSGTLETDQFYVVALESSDYHIFKCIGNNNDGQSTIKPLRSQTSPDDASYKTSDNYEWKFMYTILAADWDKFTTDNFIPIFPDADVSGNAVNGALDHIVVTTAGLNYNAYANGTFAEVTVNGNSLIYALQSSDFVLSGNNNFYTDGAFYIKSGVGAGQIKSVIQYIITGSQRLVILDSAFGVTPSTSSIWEITPNVDIDGDGINAAGRAIINATSNSVYSVEIINRGQDYTYADATIVGNTGTLDANSDVILANTSIVRPIISPDGGNGSDAINELFGSKVGISVQFSNNEGSVISTNNDIRQFTILKDPLFANVELTISDLVSSFVDGEVATQENGASGEVTFTNSSTIRITDVDGIFVTAETITGADTGATANVTAVLSNPSRVGSNFNVFNQTEILTISISNGPGYADDEKITQGVSGSPAYAEGFILEGQASSLRLTNVLGILNVGSDIFGETSLTTATINGVVKPDIINNSGEILFINNIVPITRSDTATETVRLVVEF